MAWSLQLQIFSQVSFILLGSKKVLPTVACCLLKYDFHPLKSGNTLSKTAVSKSAIQPLAGDVVKRQFFAIGLFAILFLLLSIVIFSKDRQQEWYLRSQQASYRLDRAYELIQRDLQRVRADVCYIANQAVVRNFDASNSNDRQLLENEFAGFLNSKKSFQQIRLLDLDGKEAVRVDWRDENVHAVPLAELQNKMDREYIQRSMELGQGEVFVSEFDLNQERGEIEHPVTPVIRFVTPVIDSNGDPGYLLAANFLGAPLLADLAEHPGPGRTFLTRHDGEYLLGPTGQDAWGWLLNHTNTLRSQFEAAWLRRHDPGSESFLTSDGAFAFREIHLDPPSSSHPNHITDPNTLTIVSYLPAEKVFLTSRQQLSRLFLLFGITLIPLFFLTRLWASATVRRKQQNQLIQESESKLRELSARLLRIQEIERKSISREIHDQLGQQVTAINLDLKMAALEVQPDKLLVQLRRAIQESEQLLASLHDFASRVRPVELDDLGLTDATQSYLDQFKRRTGVELRFSSDIDDKKIPAEVSENTFRLIQESLNNVAKHADATRVDVEMNLVQSDREKYLELRVKDDGRGCVNPSNLKGTAADGERGVRLGLLGMQERVDLLGGAFDWRSENNRGTEIHVVIPLRDYDKNTFWEPTR